jgi:serine/threonine protein phosphatase PrpC
MLVREELWVQAAETAHLINQLKVLASLLTVLVVVGGVLMGKRLKQLEMAFLTRTPEGPADGLREANGDKGKRTPTSRSAAPRDSSFKPVRPVTGPLPSTRDQLERIIQDAAKLKHLRVRLHHPEEPWTMGMATAKGNVRAENQDYGLCFRMADNYDVLIVADGCGGIPFGQRAAYLASVSAAVSVVRTYGTAPLLFAPGVRDAVAQAIKDAAHRLAVEGDKLNVSESRDGLRTTLIVLVGNRREVAYAYIGDGGGCVVRASGAIERFLTPQKVNELAMNVLAASLGPTVEGEFVTGTIKRMPGDLILVGTDGVFDRVGPEFPKDVLRGCIQSEGDLQATADHVIDELAAFKDGAGYICDDNLSLGLLGDGTSPRLPQGFWSTTPAQDTPVESPPGAVETAKEGAG